jgi:hypothetical protein
VFFKSQLLLALQREKGMNNTKRHKFHSKCKHFTSQEWNKEKESCLKQHLKFLCVVVVGWNVKIKEFWQHTIERAWSEAAAIAINLCLNSHLRWQHHKQYCYALSHPMAAVTYSIYEHRADAEVAAVTVDVTCMKFLS